MRRSLLPAKGLAVRNYLITICFHGGGYGRYRGQFASDWDAIDAMTDAFFNAQWICARRVS